MKMVEVGFVNGKLVGSINFTEEELKKIGPMFEGVPVTGPKEAVNNRVPGVDKLSERDLKVREIIRTHLKALDKSLEEFEQTTHGSGYYRDCPIDALVEQIATTFRSPNAYNISELSQRIGGFLKVTE